MTPHEALWLIKTQLAKTDQNLEAIKVIEELVKEYYYQPQTLEDLFKDYPEELQHTLSLDEAIEELELGNEAEHIKNHMAKVGEKDIKELKDNICARYDWAEDDELVQFYGLCEENE